MTPQQIHAVATPDGIQFFATQFLPVTTHNGARLKFWRVNLSLEKIEPAKTVSWSYEHTGQQAQLQNALGAGFNVLSQYETVKAIEAGLKTMQPQFSYLTIKSWGEHEDYTRQTLYCGTDIAQARAAACRERHPTARWDVETWKNGVCVNVEEYATPYTITSEAAQIGDTVIFGGEFYPVIASANGKPAINWGKEIEFYSQFHPRKVVFPDPVQNEIPTTPPVLETFVVIYTQYNDDTQEYERRIAYSGTERMAADAAAKKYDRDQGEIELQTWASGENVKTEYL